MAITLTLSRPLTDEDLLECSRRNPGYQFERTAKGDLIVTPTGSEAGRRSLKLTQQLANWTDRDGTGVAFDSSTGFHMPDGALLSPDASWVRHARWEALPPAQRRGFAPLCPDVVFELRSETDALTDLRAKMAGYLANSARLAVLIDPHSRTVEVFRPGQTPQMFQHPDTVALDPELPGFRLDLRLIFAL